MQRPFSLPSSLILIHNVEVCTKSFTVIKEEATDSRAEVKSFDHTKLKHVETAEKNPLPSPQTLKEEMRPESLPDVSGVKEFDASKLKHVETQDKTVLPTKDGMMFVISSYLFQISLNNIAKNLAVVGRMNLFFRVDYLAK